MAPVKPLSTEEKILFDTIRKVESSSSFLVGRIVIVDKSKFGYQLMTKMGWSEGKGLGQQLSGSTSHIKVSKKNSKSGIGSKRSHDDDWIAHQNDFNDLLNSLNQGSNSNSNSDNKIKSLEDRVKSSKKKILYTKFVKSKDLSNASSQDLACIFGRRSLSAPQLNDNEENDSDTSAASCPVKDINASTEHGFTTIRTGMSVTDYFSQKMAALAKSRENNVMIKSEEIEVEVNQKVKEEESHVATFKIGGESDSEDDELNSETINDLDNIKQIENENESVVSRKKKNKGNNIKEEDENEDTLITKKKKKKKKKNTENETNTSKESEDDEMKTSDEVSIKKKKKYNITENDCVNIEMTSEKNEVEITEEDLSVVSKKKKKKKRKMEEDEDEACEENTEIITKKRTKLSKDIPQNNIDTISQKKSKKKKNTEEITEEEEVEEDTLKEKKKKKKSKKSI